MEIRPCAERASGAPQRRFTPDLDLGYLAEILKAFQSETGISATVPETVCNQSEMLMQTVLAVYDAVAVQSVGSALHLALNLD